MPQGTLQKAYAHDDGYTVYRTNQPYKILWLLETIDGLLRAGVKWPVIQSATGIDERTYRSLKRDAANGTEQTAPR